MSDVELGRSLPNVLVIVTDQQRADHVGFGGNDVVRTPNLDALAARSTIFDRAYVANPVCSPNRSTMVTGRLPSAHGVIFNDRSLAWGANTFVRTLRAAGYRTALIGKSHLQVGIDHHQMLPSRRAPADTDGFADSVYGYEYPERYHRSGWDEPDDFYGFGHVEFAIEHGARMGGHHLRWALDRGAAFGEVVGPYDASSPALQRSSRWWQVYRPIHSADVHSTEFVAERTSAFIESASAAREPWMAWASFPDPHHPLTPPGDWFDRHDPGDMPVPTTFADPLDHVPSYVRAIRARRETPLWPFPFGTDDPMLAQEAIAATYGMVEFIDDAVGRMLDTVQRCGDADDTIVVFTSDHGDMMGDHGLMVKGSVHYEGVIRVPLTIAVPSGSPARTASLACSIDLAPTLLDLCGLDVYDGVQGHSLRPILDDPGADVRDTVLIEDDMPAALAGLMGVPATIRTLVTRTDRYTRDSLGGEQLYDLVDDPNELQDRAASSAPTTSERRTALLDLMMGASDVHRGIPADRSPT